MRYKKSGTITVFMTFISVLIITLLGTMIDLARLEAAKVYAYRTVSLGMESEFSKYCSELYDDYQLFCRLNQQIPEEMSTTEFMASIQMYLDNSFQFSQSDFSNILLDSSQSSSVNQPDFIEGKMTDQATLLDYDGELFMYQVVDAMKYEVTTDLLKQLVGKTEQLQGVADTAKEHMVDSDKLESAFSLTDYMIAFISEVEGIVFSGNDVAKTGNSLFSTKQYFAKLYCTEEVEPRAVGVNHKVVWDSLKNQYVNPLLSMQQLMMILKDAVENKRGIDSSEYLELIKQCNKAQSNVQQVINCYENGLSLIEKMKNEYAILSNQGSQSEEWNSKQLTSMLNMERQLRSNVEVLKQYKQINFNVYTNKGEQIEQLYNKTEQCVETFNKYSIRMLQFDYTYLSNESSEAQSINPITLLKNLIGDGILSLVLDNTEKISEAKLESSTLVSKNRIPEEEKETYCLQEDNIVGELSDAQRYIPSQDILPSGVENILKKACLNEYAVSMFNNYEMNKSKESSIKHDTVLAYEQEYLIAGNLNDKDNLRSIITRTVFIRTVVNYITLLLDSGASQKAEGAATLLLGITGMPPLIKIAKHLILIAWGFEESLVEMRGLLDGKKLPIFKKVNEFSISFSEILLVSPQYIKSEASKLKDSKSLLALSYKEYIRIYLLLVSDRTICYRMMDLIQNNMQSNYNDQFCFDNAIFGAQMTVSYRLNPLMLSLPMINRFVGETITGAQFEVTTSYSY